MKALSRLLSLIALTLLSGCLSRAPSAKQCYYLEAPIPPSQGAVPFPAITVSPVCEGRGLVILGADAACRTLYWHELAAAPAALISDEFIRRFPAARATPSPLVAPKFKVLFIGGDSRLPDAPKAVCEVVMTYSGKRLLVRKEVPLENRTIPDLVRGMGVALGLVFEEYARFAQ